MKQFTFQGHQHEGGPNGRQAVERPNELDPPEASQHSRQPELHRVWRQCHYRLHLLSK